MCCRNWSYHKNNRFKHFCGKFRPAYKGRFRIMQQCMYSIRGYAGSNNGITIDSLIMRLTIRNQVYNRSNFETFVTNTTALMFTLIICR